MHTVPSCMFVIHAVHSCMFVMHTVHSLMFQLELLEHETGMGLNSENLSFDECSAYCTNVGQVREKVGARMNIKSVKRGHREQDHLSKRERRLRKRATEVEPGRRLKIPQTFISTFCFIVTKVPESPRPDQLL